MDDPFVILSDEAVASTTGGSTSGGCQPVSTVSSERESFSSSWECDGNTIPSGVYITRVTSRDCWTGGSSQNCEAGTSVTTINIAGQTVCSSGGYTLVVCP